jgi:haloalkane dehalogenase
MTVCISVTPAGSDRQQPETLLLLHGNPTWSFLYRHVIPHLTAAGFRVLALDFAGFGRSDKPLEVRICTVLFPISVQGCCL